MHLNLIHRPETQFLKTTLPTPFLSRPFSQRQKSIILSCSPISSRPGTRSWSIMLFGNAPRFVYHLSFAPVRVTTVGHVYHVRAINLTRTHDCGGDTSSFAVLRTRKTRSWRLCCCPCRLSSQLHMTLQPRLQRHPPHHQNRFFKGVTAR